MVRAGKRFPFKLDVALPASDNTATCLRRSRVLFRSVRRTCATCHSASKVPCALCFSLPFTLFALTGHPVTRLAYTCESENARPAQRSHSARSIQHRVKTEAAAAAMYTTLRRPRKSALQCLTGHDQTAKQKQGARSTRASFHLAQVRNSVSETSLTTPWSSIPARGDVHSRTNFRPPKSPTRTSLFWRAGMRATSGISTALV